MINSDDRKQTKYFVGTEIEHTPCKGQKTLFVVGIQLIDEVIALAKQHELNHIYLGASQSFSPQDAQQWDHWDNFISALLKHNFLVSLDFDVQYAEDLHEEGWCENDNFIPIISVKLPYLKLFNYNTVVKIDDTTWGHSNSGVWSHSLHDLLDQNKYTAWREYSGDNIIK